MGSCMQNVVLYVKCQVLLVSHFSSLPMNASMATLDVCVGVLCVGLIDVSRTCLFGCACGPRNMNWFNANMGCAQCCMWLLIWTHKHHAP